MPQAQRCSNGWAVTCLLALAFTSPSTSAQTPPLKTLHPERSEYIDTLTGHLVTRLTYSSSDDIKIYQTHPSWTADGEWIIFHSDRRPPHRQLFAVHETSGLIVQLTDNPNVQVGQICLSRRRHELLTLIGRDVVLLDFSKTLPTALAHPGEPHPPAAFLPIAELPPGTSLSGTMSWNASETTLYAGLQHGTDPAQATWSIAGLNLALGTWNTLLKPGFRVGHVQANPWKDDWLMYCHETGGDAPQRMWLAKTDGSVDRPFYQETFDEWVTHETWWTPDSALFTVWPKDNAMKAKPHGLVSTDLNGLTRFHSRHPYWHVTGSHGSPYIVGDTFDGEIIRVETRTGERTLLTQNHRTVRKGSHPHASMNPRGNKVLFNSNAVNESDLYLVEVEGPSRSREHAYRQMGYKPSNAATTLNWQKDLRQQLASLLKISDLQNQSIPLNPTVLQRFSSNGFDNLEMTINSTATRSIKTRLTLPKNQNQPVPAVVCIHGHGGDRNSVHNPTGIYKAFAHHLAERGYATISVNVGQHEVFEAERTLMGERLWDLIRCVDYLQTLPEVDANRIGCAGLSLGGEMAMWLGAMDTRVQATLSSGFLTSMDQMEQNHCMCWKLPGLREQVDYCDIYALIAPRQLECQNGNLEGPTDFWVPLAQSAMAEIKLAYTDLNAPTHANLHTHPGGHVIDLPNLLEFFDNNLR